MDPRRQFPLSSYEIWLVVRGLQLLEEKYDQQPKRQRIERLRRLINGVEAITFTPYQRAALGGSQDAELRDQGPQPQEVTGGEAA